MDPWSAQRGEPEDTLVGFVWSISATITTVTGCF